MNSSRATGAQPQNRHFVHTGSITRRQPPQTFCAGPGARLAAPEMAATFASDAAAIDIREEKSNDPLSPLLSSVIEAKERPRYQAIRERYPFKVFKDRKFVATRGLHSLLQAIQVAGGAAGTKNLIYDLR